jgi:outer membrane protein assembly factor BamB
MIQKIWSRSAQYWQPVKRCVAPALAVWGIVAYIHLVQSLFLAEFLPATLLFLPFLPVVLFEFWRSPGHARAIQMPARQPDARTHTGGKKKSPGPAKGQSRPRSKFQTAKKEPAPVQERLTRQQVNIDGKWLVGWGGRVLFWFGFYAVWVAYVYHQAQNAQWLKWFAPRFYLQFYLVFRAEQWLTVAALLLWLCAYAVLTVRWGKLHVFTALILPMALALALFVHLYYFGGVGNTRPERVVQQEGVELWLDLKALNPDQSVHPRGICVDRTENALFIMFGCTYCNDQVYYPTVVRQDLDSGNILYFTSTNIRQVSCERMEDPASTTLFVAPWYTDVIYELSKHDLSIVARHPSQARRYLDYWEPMSVIKDGKYLYIGNDVEQAVVAYNLETGQPDAVLNLYTEGLVQFGGPAWNLVQASKTGHLYFTSGPGENLYEVAVPSLDILKHRRFRDITGTALILDEERGVLYYQNGGLSNALYEVDLATFEVIRAFKGEGHARQILLDRERNRLYVLGYFSGRAFALDLETGRRVWTVKVGGSPHGMALDGDVLWVNSMAGVFKLYLETIEEQRRP